MMDMRGSGIYCTDEEMAIDPCATCGGHDGILFTDDWNVATLECADCGAVQPLPEPDEPDEDDDPPEDWDVEPDYHLDDMGD